MQQLNELSWANAMRELVTKTYGALNAEPDAAKSRVILANFLAESMDRAQAHLEYRSKK